MIDDSATPEKIPRKRTRAVAAQEAAESLRKSALANGTGSSVATTVTGAAPGKKRKVADDVSDAGTVKKAKGKVSVSQRESQSQKQDQNLTSLVDVTSSVVGLM